MNLMVEESRVIKDTIRKKEMMMYASRSDCLAFEHSVPQSILDTYD